MPSAPSLTDRAAIVTGGSGGIGFAIAQLLLEEGFALTVAARRAEKLEAAADRLREGGGRVHAVAANLADGEEVARVVAAHEQEFGRLDVLVNNAGFGFGAPVAEIEDKRIDQQLDVNVKAMVLFYRESIGLLRTAAGERGSALVVNLASIAGKSGQPWLSVYSATKAAMVGFTQAMNKELADDSVKSVALCPGWTETDMTGFMHDRVAPEEMLRPGDVAEAVRFLLRVSPACIVPEIVFGRPGEQI